jgi:4-aminobutyrate aminotransferase-like enzyme
VAPHCRHSDGGTALVPSNAVTSSDLDLEAALEALETRQRAEAPTPGDVVEREASRVRIPPGGAMPRSAGLLERFHGGLLRPDFAVREKKPMVLDTRRCHGPFMVSVDDPPLALLDACSQIATLTHGFGHPELLRSLYAGRFDRCLWANPDTAVHHVPELAAYAQALLRLAPPALDHVCFVGAGGAEANEKALRLARLHGPAARDPGRVRVLAFEDSFHGRTLATLGATWNPDKRALFEMRGFEAVFCKATLADVERTLHERHRERFTPCSSSR